jgi:hypothetical protein
MAMALVGSFGVAVVFGARACEAKAKEISASAYAACSLLNNVIVGDIMRIKRADNDGRYILYIQPRDSIAVKIQEVYCDQLDFLADVPSGAPMYGVRRTWMNGRFCNCGMTYHIHAITDPNVE